MDGLTPHRDLGLSSGDVLPVRTTSALEAPERRVTQTRESSADSPELRHKKRDSVEISREALALSQNEPDAEDQIADSAALAGHGVSEALGQLSANRESFEDLPIKLEPALPPLPFRNIREGPDFSESA